MLAFLSAASLVCQAIAIKGNRFSHMWENPKEHESHDERLQILLHGLQVYAQSR